MDQERQFLPQSSEGAIARANSRELGSYELAPDLEDEFASDLSVTSILRVMWERKWWIALAGLIGGICALAYSLTQTPLYRAVAIMELNPPTVSVLNSGEELAVPATDYEFLETQLGILQSRALAERVVQDLDLGAQVDSGERVDPKASAAMAAGVAAGLTVVPQPDSRLVRLQYTSDDPREAAQLANAFGTSFIQLTLDRKYAETTAAREFLEERIATVREQINEAERDLVEYAKDRGIVVLNGEGGEGSSTLTGTSLASLNAALAVAQQIRITAEQRFRQADPLSQADAASAALRSEKAALEAEYREKSTYLQPSFPEMARLKTRIDELERQISGENSRTAGSLEAEFQAALAEEQQLRSRVAQLSGSALREREDAIQYNILQRELDTSRSLYDALLERYNEVGVVQGIGSAQAAMVDEALVPGAPFVPNTMRTSIIGLLLGLFIGGGLAVVYDRFTDTFKTKDDIREKLGLVPLGAIPMVQKDESFVDEVRDPISYVYDAYATLRTNIQLSGESGFPRVLLVTSSRPEEGKSSTSYSLAVQLAAVGKRVLLIDADMRRPSFIGRENEELGLSTLLTSDGSLFDHLNATSSGNLFLLPSGPIPPNPASIILPARLNALLKAACTEFDHVIVDAPPVAGFADAILLASCSNAVLFTVESGKTRAMTAQAALSQLKMSGANIVGGVLTKATTRAVDYGSYGYYYGQAERESRTQIEISADRREIDPGKEKMD